MECTTRRGRSSPREVSVWRKRATRCHVNSVDTAYTNAQQRSPYRHSIHETSTSGRYRASILYGAHVIEEQRRVGRRTVQRFCSRNESGRRAAGSRQVQCVGMVPFRHYKRPLCQRARRRVTIVIHEREYEGEKPAGVCHEQSAYANRQARETNSKPLASC